MVVVDPCQISSEGILEKNCHFQIGCLNKIVMVVFDRVLTIFRGGDNEKKRDYEGQTCHFVMCVIYRNGSQNIVWQRS